MSPKLYFICLLIFPLLAQGHGDEKHDNIDEKLVIDQTVVKQINQEYVAKIRPLFQIACFEDH